MPRASTAELTRDRDRAAEDREEAIEMWRSDHAPRLVDRWVDAVVAEAAAGGVHPRDHLKATTVLLITGKISALTRGDRLAADRAETALSAVRRRLAALLH